MPPSANDLITPRGPKRFLNSGSSRVVHVLRLFLCVEVVEIPEELIEAMIRRQLLVAIAKMVLAELPGGVPLLLEQTTKRKVCR